MSNLSGQEIIQKLIDFIMMIINAIKSIVNVATGKTDDADETETEG